MASDSHLPPGYQLREYRIKRRLGRGGFGNTYSAIHEHLNRRVAIKEYAPKDYSARDVSHRVAAATTEDEAVFQWGLDRFLDEGRALEKFDHVNIVSVHDLFRELGTAYIVMEHIDGEPLSEMLERQTTLSESQIREHVLPLTDGLAEVHAAGLLHRDIKPGNIMVRANGIPVLIDFGAARQAVNAKSRKLTAVVTDGYAPPEQYSEDPDSQMEATDIYALGAVLYRCVTGARPRNAPARASDDRLITAAEAAQNDYSEGLLTAINEALAVRIEDRPCDIRAFLKLVSLDEAFIAALATYDRLDRELALTEFRVLAELGYASAQYKLGEMYYYGLGVPHDRDQAAQWCIRAAERGHVAAQVKLGYLYANGEGVPHDHDQAVRWYSRAAEQGSEAAQTSLEPLWCINNAERGHADAQFELGDMYASGEGVPQDHTQAVKWFARAAQQGHAEAQFVLGKAYASGKGVGQDLTESIEWLGRAATKRYPDARNWLHFVNDIGNGIAEDVDLAVEWYERATEQGDDDAQLSLGLIYEQRDIYKAIEYYTDAAEGGNSHAQLRLGEVYRYGLYGIDGITQDIGRAFDWFQLAAEQGDTEAQFELGLMYRGEGNSDYFGEGLSDLEFSLDASEAVLWFTRAAEKGHARAQFKLSQMYFDGEGAPQDSSQALDWLTRAADNGHVPAQLDLACRYHEGKDLPRDPAQAVAWYTHAAELGNMSAQLKLSRMYSSGDGVRADFVKAHAWAILGSTQGSAGSTWAERAVTLRDEIAANLSPVQLAASQELSTELETRIREVQIRDINTRRGQNLSSG